MTRLDQMQCLGQLISSLENKIHELKELGVDEDLIEYDIYVDDDELKITVIDNYISNFVIEKNDIDKCPSTISKLYLDLRLISVG